MRKEHLSILIGFGLALVFGFIEEVTWGLAMVLVVFGLVIGFLNVKNKDLRSFMISGTVLVVVSALSKDSLKMIFVVGQILDGILFVFVPATIIIAIKGFFK